MNQHAKDILNELKIQYLEFSQNTPRYRNADLGGHLGYMYVRKMVYGTFCIASVNFDEVIMGQGVLSSFIEFVKENPFDYVGVEVECIQNPRLAAKLFREGFVHLRSPNEIVPTLVFPLTEDCPTHEKREAEYLATRKITA